MPGRDDSRPRVSVALPVRDARETLPLALASIRQQTLADWELLVLDDDSADGSGELAVEWAALDPRIRVLEPDGPRGLASRLNQAIGHARGEFIARMDADDVAYPERLRRQLEYLEENPGVDLVGSSMLVFRDGGEARGVRGAPASHEEICARPPGSLPLFHPTWFGRADWFRRYGYRTAARRCEDQELLFRAREASVFANLPDPLMGYREDRLPLASILRGRTTFTLMVARDARVREALAILGHQVVRGLLDVVAVSTRREQSVLRHRARSAPPEVVAEWSRVWQELGGEQGRPQASVDNATRR